LGSSDWALEQRARLSGGTVAWDRLGEGPPVVLVHGTPSWSYIWRKVAPSLGERFSVHLWDLLGYGDSERRHGLDISIAAQARYLAQLLDMWGLDSPAVVGHDIGGAIVLRAHLCEGMPFSHMSLIDAVVFNPWNTPTTMHIRDHLDAYATMPAHIYEQVVRAHLRSALAREPRPEILDAYFRPWSGPEGQRAYFRKIEQIDERQTAELESRLGEIRIPVRVIWGERDRWLAPGLATRLAAAIPGASVELIPDAGHFAMEDAPEAVAAALAAGLAWSDQTGQHFRAGGRARGRR
jgi:pimeloyl-ACP methyl ester carboxylesterase